MVGRIICFVIYLIVAAFMAGIGIFQLRSKTPVGFYSGERPPAQHELSDVAAWNRKHGIMWVVYGAVILMAFGAGCLMGDTVWSVAPMSGGVLVPIPLMVWYHKKLVKCYKK